MPAAEDKNLMEIKTCNKCGESKPLAAFHPKRRTCRACLSRAARNYQQRNPEAERQRQKEKARRLRAAVIEAYGGRCACCGEDTPEFLSVDHINNNGAQHRRELGKGPLFYRWLKANGFPKAGFQLLCFNCNCAKGFFGECPHKRRKEQQAA